MNIINFTQPGGMPLTQDKLALLQENSLDLVQAFLGSIKPSYIIIDGVEKQPDGSWTEGIIKWGKDLVRFPGSQSDVTINISIENLTDQYFDSQVKIYATKKYAGVTSGSGYLLSSLPRLEQLDTVDEFSYQLPNTQGIVQSIYAVRQGRLISITAHVAMNSLGVNAASTFKLEPKHRPKSVVRFIGGLTGKSFVSLHIKENGQILINDPIGNVVDANNWMEVEFNVTFFI